MFDTVVFKLTRTEVEGVDFLSEVAPLLNPEDMCVWQNRQCEGVTGNLHGLRVSITPMRLKVSGSICKYMLGDNYQAMGRADMCQAVKQLSDTLSLPMERATITRLDVGLSMPMREPPENYFSHLGVLRYAVRLQQPHSLYYYRHRATERLCFYDKNREQRDNREPIPEIYRDKNVLRYEQRYMGHLPKRLNVPSVTADMLYDERFYISLLNRWRDAYKDIRKINDVTPNFKVVKPGKYFQRFAILTTVEKYGGEEAMRALIDNARKRGDLTPVEAYRLREQIAKAYDVKAGFTTPSEAINELDKKISEAIRFYR